VQLVGETGQALQRIVGEVASINDLITEIAASAQEQAQGLEQVNIAVNQMDQVTQQNAAMVVESTAASHALSKDADNLNRLMSEFRVGETARPAPMGRPAPARVSSAGHSAPAANPVHAAQARVARLASGSAATAEDWSEF
jgi:methyl-accepting chemotaxis protein